MAIAKITGPGLVAMAVSVAFLWGCLIAERVSAARDLRNRQVVLLEIQELQRKSRSMPALAPAHPKGEGPSTDG